MSDDRRRMGAGSNSFDSSFLRRSCSMVSTHLLFDGVLDALRRLSMFQASLPPAAYSSIPSFGSGILVVMTANIL